MTPANPLIAAIRNSTAEKAEEALVQASQTPVVVTSIATPEWSPAKGETLFEPSFEGALVRTAFPDGREIGFPYITSAAEEVEFLTAFAAHCGQLTVTEGE